MNRIKQRLTLKNIITFITITGAVYFLLGVSYNFAETDQHKNIFIAYSLILSFLVTIEPEKKFSIRNIISVIGIVLTIGAAYYVHVNYYDIIFRIGKSTNTDIVVGIILIILGLIATRRLWGNIITGIVIASIAYAYWGHLLPGAWFHSGLPLHRIVGYSTLYMQGMYGSLTMVTCVTVFVFVMFGSILDAAGGAQCFINIAQNFSKKLKSGVAQVAVISSALMGTISGNIAANVATTGAVTIPAMIKSGVKKEYAAAVEAAASTGGQIMPPVMGVAAFLIVGITGIPYLDVCKASLFPALLFYFYLFLSLQIRALKQDWTYKAESEKIKWAETLKQYFHLLIPFGVIMYCLIKKMPPSIAAYYAVLTMIILVIARTFYDNKSDFKGSAKKILEILKKGLYSGGLLTAKLGVSVAVLGILVEIFVVTGLAQTIAFAMVEYSRGILLLLLLFTGIVCVFFGMGMSTASAYLIVATLAAPALREAGLPVLHSHLFVFYFGVLSSVTPPVARGVMVATTMIGDEKAFWKVAAYTLKLAFPVFIVPFFWAYRPELLWTNDVPIAQTLYNLSIVTLGSISMISLFERFMFSKLSSWQIPLLIVSALCAFIPSSVLVDTVGVCSFAVVAITQYLSYKSRNRLEAAG